MSPATLLQSVSGFGGAITDSVAHVFSTLSKKHQDEVVEALWGATGQRYNLGRLTIGSTDFSTTIYNYNTHKDDFPQSNFSIDHDTAQIIPLALRAQKAAQDSLHFVSSPWSPPGWMKQTWWVPGHYMRNSAKPGMIQKPEARNTAPCHPGELSHYAFRSGAVLQIVRVVHLEVPRGIQGGRGERDEGDHPE